MASCHRNNVGSLVLGHHHNTKTATVSSHFRLWNSLSAASFRRIIFDAVSCGASSRYRHYEDDFSSAASTARSDSSCSDEKRQKQQQRLEHRRKPNARSEKLSDLLSMAESEAEAETKKKEETLEELKQLVKELQQEEDLAKRRAAAATVRLLAKEDLEVRGTLAMLGVIPPLVAMLDSEDVDSHIASLYALLNLGIGNDA